MLPHRLRGCAVVEGEIPPSRGLATFVEVGEAFRRIRDRRLYRAAHGTFEAYCQERWGLKQSHVYRLMDSAEVMANLKSSPIGELFPANEAQARPLAALAPEVQREVWQAVVAQAGEHGITADRGDRADLR
jgi:hypothetical protein